MDLNGYFDPVSLERPEFEYLDTEETFSHQLSIHTPDHPIRELDKHQVALMGIPADTNAFLKGSREAPDAIRSKLYQLRKINKNLKIYDLGNIKNGATVNDTYFGVRDVLLELMEREIVAVILGGSQDITRGALLALEQIPGLHHILTIDAMLDFSRAEEVLSSRNYLNQVMDPAAKAHFSYTNLGHQAYFVSGPQLDQLEKSYLESIRLGDARRDIKHTEPLIRDSKIISIDMGAMRQGDAPGAAIPTPNGFTGDELCQITRYAGLSEQVRMIGYFEYIPAHDRREQTAHLIAQSAWYFLEGLARRIRENPAHTPEHMKKFIVNLNAAGHDLIFHKSTLSDRWWMEIPVRDPVTGHNFMVSCSHDDYQQACNQEIPDRWWRFLHRLGNEMD